VPSQDDKLRVMIVEDEPDISIILSEILSAFYEVVVASNGLEALERIARYEPDLTVMDLMMPVLDGFDTTRAIKKDARYAHMPVLFLTARKDNQSVREALLSGGDIYLEKPFNPPELLERIQEIVAKNRVMPRKKQYTVEEVNAYFEAQANAPPPPPVQHKSRMETRPPRPLTEQLTAKAAEPRVRILAVDDDADVLNFTRTILADDYEVITTHDSESAPDKIIAYQPDILLLDIQMPKLNGFHLSHLIRLNRRLRGAKIIFVSSRSDPASLETAFNLGASEYLEKPFTPEQLKRKLRDVTAKHDFQRSKKRIEYREILRRETQSSHM
jgi:DNA-binding response OmpR family regulator